MSKKTILLLVISILVAAFALTACAAPSATQAPAEKEQPQATAVPEEKQPEATEMPKEEAKGESELEIFSWWTAGGEADGLNAMFKIFNEKYPDVEIINATVAGGAGSNAKAVLATRMQSGNPPDSFQVHAGHELIDTWVVADKMLTKWIRSPQSSRKMAGWMSIPRT